MCVYGFAELAAFPVESFVLDAGMSFILTDGGSVRFSFQVKGSVERDVSVYPSKLYSITSYVIRVFLKNNFPQFSINVYGVPSGLNEIEMRDGERGEGSALNCLLESLYFGG